MSYSQLPLTMENIPDSASEADGNREQRGSDTEPNTDDGAPPRKKMKMKPAAFRVLVQEHRNNESDADDGGFKNEYVYPCAGYQHTKFMDDSENGGDGDDTEVELERVSELNMVDMRWDLHK